ncbi:hypothetical protein KDA11_03755, partial [Candidatus Saccharibacteria bacterium]|nr:hypothetical protein [Candidatus Saccharibacteria bacterium]
SPSPSPSPGPGPAPSSGVTKPSEYTGKMSMINPPTTKAATCGTSVNNPADGVGWVLNNQSDQNATFYIGYGTDCDTSTPKSKAWYTSSSGQTCPPGQTLTWTQASYKHPLAVGQYGMIKLADGTNIALYTPTDINPATQYAVFTVSGISGTYTHSVDTYNY